MKSEVILGDERRNERQTAAEDVVRQTQSAIVRACDAELVFDVMPGRLGVIMRVQ
jgi:hypothetical protein